MTYNREQQSRYYTKHKQEVLDRSAAYYSSNKDKVKKRCAEYYAKNKDKIRKRVKIYRASHKDIENKQKAIYRETHRKERDAYRIKNAKEAYKKIKEWKKRNPDKIREYRRTRRVKKLNSSGVFTNAEWKVMIEAHDHRCFYCKNKIDRLEQDHIKPLSRGGRHEASNIVPACRKCNGSKSDLDVEVFLSRMKDL